MQIRRSEHFRRNLLQGFFRILLARQVASNQLQDRSAAVTFDDGYADNRSAIDILLAHGIPATLFIVSDPIGTNKGFWWDELEQILLRPHPLPSKLRLQIRG